MAIFKTIFDAYNQDGQDEAFAGAMPPPPTASSDPVIADPNLNMPKVQPDNFSQTYDTTGWDVDSYGAPKYIAQNFGDAPSGWDPTKWADPTHQTPKYVWGRIYQEAQASGDPNWMQTATQKFMQAYPGSQMISGDKIMTPWGEEVDLFRDFGGANGISWNVMGAPSGPGGFDISSLLSQFAPQGAAGASAASGAAQSVGSDVDPFAAIGGGVRLANGDWVPKDHPAAAGAKWQGGATTSAAGGTTTTGPQAPQGGMQSLYDAIGRLLGQGGGLNDDILNRRVESTRETLERQRNAELDTMQGQLSARGLLGQGAEIEGTGRVNERIADMFGGQVRDIYADESARSDERLLRTMSIAAGLSADDADRLVDWFNAQTGRDVGMGQIAADRERTGVQRELGQGDLAQRAADLALRRDLGFGDLGLREYETGLDYNKWQNEFGLEQDRFAFDQSRSGQQDLISMLPLLFPQLFE